MSAHTQGLLVRDHRGHPHADVRAASGRAVVVTWGVCASAPKTAAGCEARTDEDRANADRIVAAWNACDGISTEALEGGAVRELLKALRIAEDSVGDLKALEIVRAAIAHATGATP